MAGRDLKALIAAYHARDDLAFRRAAQAIIEEEEAKRHTALARDLRRLLAAGSQTILLEPHQHLPEPPRDRDTNVPLADVTTGGRATLEDLVFSRTLRDQLRDLVDEVMYWPALDAAGVPRRARVLLYGPPGCGKTSIAGALATTLGWPLVTMRVDSLISSYLGETAANLRSLFDFAMSAPSVTLLDEFDSLGKLRDDPSDHGELRRVVNAVLQMIDKYRGPSIILAATNNPQVLDAAIWRRFDQVLEVPLPEPEQISRLFARLLNLHPSDDLATLAARELHDLPFAAVEHAANGAKRRTVLDRRTSVTLDDVCIAIRDTRSRPWG